MEFRHLVEAVEDEPLFETGLLLAGAVDPADVRRQLVRWTRAGRILQLRRGLYALAPPFRKNVPHPFLVANRLRPGSYVSLQSALAHHGMIPEGVPLTTSVTGGRPAALRTPLGHFDFRHIRAHWLRGYEPIDLGGGQVALVATAEKALLDLVHLWPGGDSSSYLRSLPAAVPGAFRPRTPAPAG